MVKVQGLVSFGARTIGIALVILVQLSCANSASIDKNEIMRASQDAAERDDFEEVYRLILPLAEAGDSEAQFSIAAVLAGREGIISPAEEQERISVMWLRKSAYSGWHEALHRLSDSYKWGWTGLPKDLQVSRCYKDAASGLAQVQTCREMEISKGYVVQSGD